MKKFLVSLVAVAMMACGVALPAGGAWAETSYDSPGRQGDQFFDDTDSTSSDASTLTTSFKTIINVILGVIGLLAVVVIILGGINYMTSQGDPQKVKKATNTILYGVIGLVIALLAFAIVNFVLGNVFD